jgi:hypothetical protein
VIYPPVLRARAQRKLKQIQNADLVIGVPSYRSRKTTLAVARAALDGVRRHYPSLRVVLINADAGDAADTRRAVRRLALHAQNGSEVTNHVLSERYSGPLGSGSAIAAVLDAALALDARATVVLDGDTASIGPDWLAGLAHLVLNDRADLVLPRYRHWLQPDGLLSDLVCFPLFRALWGQSVRYPLATDFAIGSHLATALLDEDVWGTAVAGQGLMPWLTTFATVHGWRLAQAAVGEKSAGPAVAANGRAVSRSGVNTHRDQFQALFFENLSVLFSQVYQHQRCWQPLPAIQSLPTLTQFAPRTRSTGLLDVDVTDLLDELALGWIEFRPLWQKILIPSHLSQLESLAILPPDQFYFPADLWARIVYDFVTVFNQGDLDPNQVLASLFPLYQGRLAAYSQEVAGLAVVGREGTIAAQAVEFEESRDYLKMRWNDYQSRFYQPGIDDRPVV